MSRQIQWEVNFDERSGVLYITSPSNRPASGVEMPGGIVFRFAEDDGALVGVTLLSLPPNFQFQSKLD